MELEQAIKTRRSVRRFTGRPLEQGVLEKIFNAGIQAPSHCNTQGWKFIFVDDADVKEKIFAAGGSYAVRNAPYGILVLYSTALSDNLEYRDWLQSSAAAIQNMLLTIHDLGLGGCWICHLPRKNVLRKIFSIPKLYSPVAYIIFGYPQTELLPMPRRYRLEEVWAANKFVWPNEKLRLNIRLKRVAKKIYFILPDFVKKIIMPLTDKLVKKFNN
ncbi:MAG: nitroreductase family protein [Patescibacteria group bacterium]|jgi:nitroreductase